MRVTALQPPPPNPITFIFAGLATKLVLAISSSFTDAYIFHIFFHLSEESPELGGESA
jgi:hypothetical protein